jgi:hypothetical protein
MLALPKTLRLKFELGGLHRNGAAAKSAAIVRGNELFLPRRISEKERGKFF